VEQATPGGQGTRNGAGLQALGMAAGGEAANVGCGELCEWLAAGELLQQLQAEGAAGELARVKAVLAQGLPGHEALVQQLAFDGKTTGPEAASAVARIAARWTTARIAVSALSTGWLTRGSRSYRAAAALHVAANGFALRSCSPMTTVRRSPNDFSMRRRTSSTATP
jgi:hypothetical protein